MSFIKSFGIKTDKTRPFPFNVSAVRYAKNIELNHNITFLIGDNGTGKSTLLETLAMQIGLPLIGGFISSKRGFEAASLLKEYLEISWIKETSKGFFFRAEDFSHFIDSVERSNLKMDLDFAQLRGEVPDAIIEQMKQNNNLALHNMRKDYGQDMQAFSHGEAYLNIMHQRIKSKGIYLLDEPEAALSPARQLSLIYFIQNHLSKHQSQFIIATHSPMLMAIPGASIYQITDDEMIESELEDTEHYYLTKGFLNNPEAYLRHL